MFYADSHACWISVWNQVRIRNELVCVYTLLTTTTVIKIDFVNAAASQGLCELPNLILIDSTAPVPVVSLDQPLCFGCVFPMGLTAIPIPLGTEWEVISNGNVTLLANDTDGVTLSDTNGTILLGTPSDFLSFDTSQIRCTFTAIDAEYSITTTVTQAGRSCLLSLSLGVSYNLTKTLRMHV